MNTPGNNNRLTLLMIAGVPVIIILASTWLWYYVASGRLDIVGVLGTANQGTLLDPPLSVAELGLVDAQGTPFVPQADRPLWRILLNGGESCEETCRQLLHYTRQIHTAMGKYTNRIERVMVTTSPVDADLVQNYPKVKLLYTSASGLETLKGASADKPPPGYFVVDPAGWVILSYAADADGKDIMADLKFLLKNSN